MDENEISKVIVDAAIEVHRTLGGPGLLESVYQGSRSLGTAPSRYGSGAREN